MADDRRVIDQKVQEWLQWDKNKDTCEEIEALVKEENYQRLHSLLCTRMQFGTAGLRAAMGAGYSRMNDLTIIQTAQGFSAYMLQTTEDVKSKGVIIGYDARHNSKRFAELTACVMLQQGIPVHLFSSVCPTPFVAFGVLLKGCGWGVMVTASHNPKQDNGFKVYYSNGAQIISPHDTGISENIMANLEPRDTSWDTGILKSSKILHDPYDEVQTAYYQSLLELSFNRDLNGSTDLKFTYTAMHGVGYKHFSHAFHLFGFQACVPVPEQVEPDPDFPTVKYPNPEEGKSALDLSIRTAERHGSNIILANDPDADRLAVAQKKPDGEWHTFTGNELGILLAWWLIRHYKESHDGSNGYCIASTVSTRMVKRICEMEGLGYEETLTGFKYMGNMACKLMQQGRHVLFAFEEAIGYMCSSSLLDKDGISAAVVAAEMAVWARSQGKTLLELLHELYDKYGYYTSLVSYYLCDDKQKIRRIFERIRQYAGGEEGGLENANQYPKVIGSYKVKYIRDLRTGFDSQQSDGKSAFPVSKSEEMMTLTFETPPVILTLRTSGTEPKIKYYCEYCSDRLSGGISKEETSAELEALLQVVLQELLQPTLNQLQHKQ